jgi:hypothetical protein
MQTNLENLDANQPSTTLHEKLLNSSRSKTSAGERIYNLQSKLNGTDIYLSRQLYSAASINLGEYIILTYVTFNNMTFVAQQPQLCMSAKRLKCDIQVSLHFFQFYWK